MRMQPADDVGEVPFTCRACLRLCGAAASQASVRLLASTIWVSIAAGHLALAFYSKLHQKRSQKA